MRGKIFFLTTVLVLLLSNSMKTFAGGDSSYRKGNLVRVAVVKNKPELTLSIKGNYEIYALGSQMKLSSGCLLKNTVIFSVQSGLKMNDENFNVFGIRILTDKERSIYINNRRFRGYIDIIRSENLKLLAVNHLDIEDYLFGVLQYEVSHRWPAEVLKAQAVAARTYALYQAKKNKDKLYDLTDDTYSQVYGGADKEYKKTKQAVLKTKGQVLTYKDEIFPAYFHAACGGHTEDSSQLWNISIPPLQGVKCDFCKNSPHYFWQKTLNLKFIEQKLNQGGYDVSDINSLEAVTRNASNRMSAVRITHKNGVLELQANKFRLLLGSSDIRSTNLTIEMMADKVLFKGFGWGHGVGLCQWGAYFMSRHGFGYEEILKYYYPDSKITDYCSVTLISTSCHSRNF